MLAPFRSTWSVLWSAEGQVNLYACCLIIRSSKHFCVSKIKFIAHEHTQVGGIEVFHSGNPSADVNMQSHVCVCVCMCRAYTSLWAHMCVCVSLYKPNWIHHPVELGQLRCGSRLTFCL